MGIRSKIKYYYTAVVAKLSIFSNLFLRKRIVIKRTPVRGKYVRQLSESFDFHFFFHALAWCCQVCQSFIAALRNCCANLICTFFLHIFTKKNLVNSNEYFYYFSSLDWEVKNMFSKHVSVMEKESFLWKMMVIPTEYFRIMDRTPDRGTGTDLLIQVINWF